jgi:hypothetical protein
MANDCWYLLHSVTPFYETHSLSTGSMRAGGLSDFSVKFRTRKRCKPLFTSTSSNVMNCYHSVLYVNIAHDFCLYSISFSSKKLPSFGGWCTPVQMCTSHLCLLTTAVMSSLVLHRTSLCFAWLCPCSLSVAIHCLLVLTLLQQLIFLCQVFK